jgi:hypothetical protein
MVRMMPGQTTRGAAPRAPCYRISHGQTAVKASRGNTRMGLAISRRTTWPTWPRREAGYRALGYDVMPAGDLFFRGRVPPVRKTG